MSTNPGSQLRCLSTAAVIAPTHIHANNNADDAFSAISTMIDGSTRESLTPSAVVELLNKYIIGQEDAKRAVAIALRNRWRRHKIPSPMKDEIVPKNILMIGPTGCGKTEIARRLAKLADAPFIKVEATKYTELGFVGRDVEDIVKDLVENAVMLTRQRIKDKIYHVMAQKVEDQILSLLCGQHATPSVKEAFRGFYREGVLEDREVELEVPSNTDSNPLAMMDRMVRGEGTSRRPEKRKMKVHEAKTLLQEAEAERYLSSELVTREALRSAEQDGIVFIDEVDKIVVSSNRYVGGNVSSEGVQRDLLPIIEGCVVNTKYGNVSTDHMLFICSGAFHSCKPSDMLAELQGRLPIRVELRGLKQRDFYRILTEPQVSMLKQQQVLLATEGVELQFTDAAVQAISRVTEEANTLLDNIGARRLHTVIERCLADVSFTAPDLAEEARAAGKERAAVVVDEERVAACMRDVLLKQDLSKYVL